MSQFVNYVLTLGQQAAPKYGYATLGLSLERYGIDKVIADVPGGCRPDGGGERRLFVRRSHTNRSPGRPDHADLWRDERHSSSAATRGRQRGHHQRQHRCGQGSGHCHECEAAQVRAEDRRPAGAQGEWIPPSRSVGTSAMASTGIDALPVLVFGVLLLGGRVDRASPHAASSGEAGRTS